MPGWTTTTRFATSSSTIRSIRSSESAMQPSIALAAPHSPLSAPCGTTGTPSREATRRVCWTCSVSRAITTTAGVPAGQNVALS